MKNILQQTFKTQQQHTKQFCWCQTRDYLARKPQLDGVIISQARKTGSNIMCVYICSANFICSFLIGFSGPQFTVTLCNVSILPSARSSQQTQQHSVSVPLCVQMTAACHAIKTDCGVGVSAVCNNCCDILVQKNIFNTEI